MTALAAVKLLPDGRSEAEAAPSLTFRQAKYPGISPRHSRLVPLETRFVKLEASGKLPFFAASYRIVEQNPKADAPRRPIP